MQMMAENYQLKWHSFSSYLHSCVSNALNRESFTDVALLTLDGHQIMAHRFILSANSQYFHQILKLHPKITTTLPILLVLPAEISHKTMKILIQYMYSGEATVSNDILENVLRGGDILRIKGLYRPKEQTAEQQNGVKVSSKPSTSSSSASSTSSQQITVKNLTKDKKDTNASNVSSKKIEKIVKEPELSSEESDHQKQDDQYLVIKEEPIDWSDEQMELIDEKDVFNTEMTIKPEVLMEDDCYEQQETATERLYSPLTCELCTETFTIPAEWVRHVQTHTDMLPAKRQRRDKPNNDEDNATFPSLQCDLCSKSFDTPAEWVRHIQDTHTEFELHLSNKKIPKDKCVIVQDTKQMKQMNDIHKICPNCNKTFPSHASMVIHKRTHTGERPYTCDHCCKGFNVKSNLLRHMRTLHGKIMDPGEVDRFHGVEKNNDSSGE